MKKLIKWFKDNKKRLLGITIILTLVFGVAGFFWWYKEYDKDLKTDIRIDALRLINKYQKEHLQKLNEESSLNCYVLEEDFSPENFYHINAGNYVGSIGFLNEENADKAEIWLTDGQFAARGTEDDLVVYKIEMTAELTKLFQMCQE